MDAAVDLAGRVEFELPVCGRFRIQRKGIAFGQELGAGGGRGKQLHIAAPAFERLVHMSPDHGTYVGMRVHDLPELGRVGQTDAVKPAAAHRDRMMMQAHQSMVVHAVQRFRETIQFLPGQTATHRASFITVQHDDLPPLRAEGSADLEWLAGQFRAHGIGDVMIAGNTEHRASQVLEQAAEAGVPGRIVLDQIATDHDGRMIRAGCEGLLHHLAQGQVGLHAAQPAIGTTIQMWVGELQDFHCGMLANEPFAVVEPGHGQNRQNVLRDALECPPFGMWIAFLLPRGWPFWDNCGISPDEFTMPTRRDLANAIRALTMDAVQQANSGHPGAPMGMADMAEVLWRDVLKHNPGNPTWWDRDRFVLSNGHASMLLYSVLYLTGYPLSLDEIRRFRQFGSKTPGHPEHDPHLGIETTTGPLGQGLANAVGMALAERALAATFNRPGHEIIDHHTYVFMGDGCLMEGISHEACSLAGTQKLGKLIALYDDNGISIDGHVKGWFADRTPERFAAYGWHVIPAVDGQDADAVAKALAAARAVVDRPSILCCQTTIGWGAPDKQGTRAVHGEALGAAEVAAARRTLGWNHPPFEIPADIRAAWDCRDKGASAERQWQERFDRYAAAFPELAAELQRRMRGELPAGFQTKARSEVARVQAAAPSLATRQSSQAALDFFGPMLPELMGGSADLTPSNGTLRKDSVILDPESPGGNYLHFGVREFGMSAILSGFCLHGGFIPYGGTFLTFSDYARNAVRMAALMRQGVVFVYTHDSIGLGEDGPTHQPIEQTASLRLIPDLELWRPCDAVEATAAWGLCIADRQRPTCLVLTRQSVPCQPRDAAQLPLIERGGYILVEPAGGMPEAIVIASGSEVGIAAEAVRGLNAAGRRIRLVSMPSTTVFDRQDAAYRESVLPAQVSARVAVEAGATGGWWRYVGLAGRIIGIDHFGASAPARDLFQHFGFTADNVRKTVEAVLKG